MLCYYVFADRFVPDLDDIVCFEDLMKEEEASAMPEETVAAARYVCVCMHVCVYMRVCVCVCASGTHMHVCVYVCWPLHSNQSKLLATGGVCVIIG